MFLQACLMVSGGVVIGAGAKDRTIFSTTSIHNSRRQQNWTDLFDGNSLQGWRYFKDKPGNSWEVNEGILHCKANTPGLVRGDLVTVDQYDNFELSIEWKVGKGANSGILYLVKEDQPASYESGPEYQLIDDLGYPSPLEPWQKSGANYAMHAPSANLAQPAGNWNHTRIIVNKGAVEHWLNGTKVVSYQLGDTDWQKRKSESKWKDTPTYGTAPKGHIALQDHGGDVWFRGIRIRKI